MKKDYVDLGLSVKWATCNIGTSKPEEYGSYFAWGEVVPKNIYKWGTYKWCNSTNRSLTKYNTNNYFGTVDNKIILDLENDIAAVNMGNTWRMPTDAEWTELREKCEWTWIRNYNGTGVAGRIVTSKINGNSIFLPAAGFRYHAVLNNADSEGYYWSSSLDTDYPVFAWGVFFLSGNVGSNSYYRYYGQSVRPVIE